MPKKGKGKKGKGKKKGKKVLSVQDAVMMTKFLMAYEKNCAFAESKTCPWIRSTMKACIEDKKLLTRFILQSETPENDGDSPVLIEPLLVSIRQARFTAIKDLFIWDYPMSLENVASLSLLLEKRVYPVRQLEMMDCLLEPCSVSRLSRTFSVCDSLTVLNLDYNEFGDEGCKYLCKGLEGNITMLSLSLCFCDLSKDSGKYIGRVVSTTAVREVFLDGNDLECEGVTEVIKLCVDQAEIEAYKRVEAARLKAEEETLKAQQEREKRLNAGTQSELSADPDSDGGVLSTDKKKKKKGKKKKKTKEPPPPPPVGPWLYKLHVADNGIDAMGESGELAPIICMRLFRKLLMCSECLEELDLEDNLIGDLGGREIMEGLSYRKEEKLGGVKMRTTHRMNSDTFNSIVKLGSGLKKKKKGKKKGKKKKK